MSGSTSVALRETAPYGALAIQAEQTAWDKMQLAALGQLGLKGAPEGDLAVFLHVSQRTGLDPFARQIYMIKRREKVGKDDRGKDIWADKWTIQTGIDGFRVTRARAERQAGVRGILGRPVFYDRDGNEYKAWVRSDHPAACEITYTVRDANGETPYTSILRFDEYAQSAKGDNGQRYLTGQWATKGAHMLEKCCEADVYRKAFPQDFSGVQLDDAMPPPDPDDAPPVQPARQRVSADQARARSGTDWKGHAERGAQRFAEQRVVAEVLATESPSPADAPVGAGEDPTPAASSSADAGPSPRRSATSSPASPSSSGAADTPKTPAEIITGHLERLGWDRGRDARLRVTSRLARRPVTSTGELSPAEQGQVIGQLAACTSAADLNAMIAELASASDPRGEAGE